MAKKKLKKIFECESYVVYANIGTNEIPFKTFRKRKDEMNTSYLERVYIPSLLHGPAGAEDVAARDELLTALLIPLLPKEEEDV